MSRFLVPISVEQAHIHHVGKHVVITGLHLQLAYIYMPPHVEVAWHSHPQESFVVVLEGGYEMWVGDEHFSLVPGQACWIPAQTPHRATVGPEATVELEAFAPAREEWAALTPHFDFRRGSDPE